jgi:hypothetical protein
MIDRHLVLLTGNVISVKLLDDAYMENLDKTALISRSNSLDRY